ncbi:hypothetical protein [Sinorhizobium meliloti]|uniref:hypothetical protein n=1 Tax=Rhizobium meliloti TaxID=382 RepID=UPI000FDCCAE9|nr:hypothetical protein [Sinorhizobium meliloti]RVO69639.1 hypothetical protein CN087_08910 [Sinorhizobium meliloti]
MARIPRWAEKLFSARCSLGDAVASQPDEDVNGWDYFIEFPDRSQTFASEKSPARRQAFAQIKSTTGSGQRSNVKLSNMLKACNSQDPWFIFLVRKDGVIFGREIINDLLYRALKEVRRARLDGKQLHKRSISVEFGTNDRIEGDVVAWMETRFGASWLDYAETKKKQFETKGYERGYGTGKLTITANSVEDFRNNFLGLGSGLQVDRFVYNDNRFGLPELIPEFGGKGHLFVKPDPIDTCQIKLKGPKGEPPVVVGGSVYGFKPPLASPADGRIRFSHPPIEIVISTSVGRLLLRMDENQRDTLPRFALHAKLLRWMRTGAIQIQVRRRGALVWQGMFPRKANKSVPFEDIVTGLETIAAQADLSNFQFSFADLNLALPTIYDAAILVSPRNLRMEIEKTAIKLDRLNAVMYAAYAELAGSTVAAIVERPILEDVLDGKMRCITMGRPSVLETYLIENEGQDAKSVIHSELDVFAKETGAVCYVLIVPDIMERLADSRQSESAAADRMVES